MLSDIVTAINILQEIKEIYDKLKSNLEALKLLGERVEIFNKILQELKDSNNGREITTSLEDSLKSLNQLLMEIKDYIEKNSIQENKSVFRKFFFFNNRNKIENDIKSFIERIYATNSRAILNH